MFLLLPAAFHPLARPLNSSKAPPKHDANLVYSSQKTGNFSITKLFRRTAAASASTVLLTPVFFIIQSFGV